MFHGSIPDAMKRIIHEVTAEWSVSDIYIGCSGNFTVERALADGGNFRLHGNDVTIYSYAIGSFLAGQVPAIQLKPEHAERFGWLEPFLETPAGRVATIMLSTTLLNSISANGVAKDNLYYKRLNEGFQLQFPSMHAKTAQKLEGMTLRLASYHNGDVVPWLQTIPGDAGVVSYPPFFAGDYEAMFSKLDLLFAWDKPTYNEIGSGGLQQFLDALTGRDFWAFGSNREWSEFQSDLIGVTQTSNRGVPIYLYAKTRKRRVVMPRQIIEPVLQPRLMPGEQVAGAAKLHILSDPQFRALRSQYMNHNIRPGQSSMNIGLTIGGKLVGVFAYSVAPSHDRTPGIIYMLSDFAVAPTDYPRLSKLVLYAALSHEAKLLAERVSRQRIRQVLTTAFSNNPISMKYRGLFTLKKRVEQVVDTDSTAHDQQRYMLNYIAPAGQWSLQEGVETWLKKHA